MGQVVLIYCNGGRRCVVEFARPVIWYSCSERAPALRLSNQFVTIIHVYTGSVLRHRCV